MPISPVPEPDWTSFELGFETDTEPALQEFLEKLDMELRTGLSMHPDLTSCGILDLRTLRLALVRPDRGEYAASVAKIGILLAWFDRHPDPAALLPGDRMNLSRMAKLSSNEWAAHYSRQLGLHRIQEVLHRYRLYDPAHGGGLWVGRHYGKSIERYGDPLHDHSHALTVRQVMRFFLWLEQGKLVSPGASRAMRDIFAAPDLPHDDIKFVKGLTGRPVEIIRKWGTWQDWKHDAAVITGPGRHYILVGVTRHPSGDEYLERLALRVDQAMAGG